MSGERSAIYIDKLGLREVAPLLADFQFYEMYFVHLIELEFVPNQPVTVGGTFHAAPDYDPIDPFPDTLAGLSNAFNYVQKPITSNTRVKMPNFKLTDGTFVRPPLYTGANNNDRLVSFGEIFYEAVSSLSDGTNLGTLILHYDISFQIPQPAATDFVTSMTNFSLKSVCDNTGNVGVSEFTSGTVNDALLTYDTAHSASTVVNADHVYSGVIDKLTGLTLESVGGKAIHEGTRVFFKTPTMSVVSDVITQLIGTASSMGFLSLGRDFAQANTIKINRTADGWIDFSNISVIT